MNNKHPLSFLTISASFLVLCLSLALVVVKTNNPDTANFDIRTQAALNQNVLSLNPDAGVYSFDSKVSYPLTILLQTENPVSTLSVQLSFDPTKVSVQSNVSQAKVFDQQMNVTVDNNKGIVTIFGANSKARVILSPVATLSVLPKVSGLVEFTMQAGMTNNEQALSVKLNEATMEFK